MPHPSKDSHLAKRRVADSLDLLHRALVKYLTALPRTSRTAYGGADLQALLKAFIDRFAASVLPSRVKNLAFAAKDARNDVAHYIGVMRPDDALRHLSNIGQLLKDLDAASAFRESGRARRCTATAWTLTTASLGRRGRAAIYGTSCLRAAGLTSTRNAICSPTTQRCGMPRIALWSGGTLAIARNPPYWGIDSGSRRPRDFPRPDRLRTWRTSSSRLNFRDCVLATTSRFRNGPDPIEVGNDHRMDAGVSASASRPATSRWGAKVVVAKRGRRKASGGTCGRRGGCSE